MELLWKIVWQFLKKLNIKLPYDSIIPFLSIYPKKLKTGTQTDIFVPMYTEALFTIAPKWKQPKCPSTDEWINKM